METPNENRLKFHLTLDEFFEATHGIRDCYTIDLAEISGFDPTMGQLYLDALNLKIAAAELLPTDDQIRDEQAQLTADVEEQMLANRNASQAFNHFIDRAYPDKPRIRDAFGCNDYEAARKSQPKMIVFMRTFFQMVKKHEAELLAVGASQVLIDGLEGHYVALTKANDLQEFAKRQRIIQTDHRITVYNELWDIITNICRVGKIVFYNNYGKYRQYVLYKGAGSGSDVLSGDVPAEGTVVILDQNITPETNFKLHNTGTTVLKFCLENNTGECTGGIELSAVEQQEHTALQIGTGTILKCTNKSTTEEGKYEVEVS